MIRISAPKTLEILEYILNSVSFSQTEIKEKTKNSIGLVNKIVNWLLDKNFIIKEDKKYKLIQPCRLVELIAIQTTFKKIQTYEISLNLKESINLIKKNKGILCLNSALEIHSNKKQDSEIHIYNPDIKLKEKLNSCSRGNTKINIYFSDLDSPRKYNICTDELRTILDFYARNMHSSVEKLALKKWGTLQ